MTRFLNSRDKAHALEQIQSGRSLPWPEASLSRRRMVHLVMLNGNLEVVTHHKRDGSVRVSP